MRCLSTFLLTLLISGSSVIAQQSAPPSEWEEIQNAYNDEWKEAETSQSISVPLLEAPDLEKKWGKPALRVAPDGSYWLHYLDPESSLEMVAIYGFAKPIPQLSSAPNMSEDVMKDGELASAERAQAFQTTRIKVPTPDGKARLDLRYFREYAGGGADGPIDTTDTLRFTINGKSGYYVVKVMSVTKAFLKRLKELEIR